MSACASNTYSFALFREPFNCDRKVLHQPRARLHLPLFAVVCALLQVEYTDVIAFGVKLLQELAQLVEAAAAAQQPDAEGLCQLCEREMPLTKHHLIPRWGQALQLQLLQLCCRSGTFDRLCGMLMALPWPHLIWQFKQLTTQKRATDTVFVIRERLQPQVKMHCLLNRLCACLCSPKNVVSNRETCAI